MSKRKQNPLIVPIFIPHMGCPHRCVFCEQEKITSQPARAINRTHVTEILDKAIRSEHFDPEKDTEVAFYGGTFTRLPPGLMKELLEAVAPYITEGFFRSIRISTRPDSLDQRRLDLMRKHSVLTVELGAQSMDEGVLLLSQRGHTASDTSKAVYALRKNGFNVGIQLMPGLPGDSKEIFSSTISEVISLRPDMVRLYPALVIKGTQLDQWYVQGKYKPLTLDDAIEICADSCIRLEANNIPVIRMGLMSSPSLLEKGQIVGGPWHPSFGFMVRSAVHKIKIRPGLPKHCPASKIRIFAPKSDIPLIRGYKNRGITEIKLETGAEIIEIESDDAIPSGAIKVEEL